jgi:hypothetical protein
MAASESPCAQAPQGARRGTARSWQARPARLTRALDRALGWETEFRVLPEVRQFLARAAAAGLIPRIEDDEVLRGMAGMNPFLRAMTRDTISLTTLRAATSDVVPGRSDASTASSGRTVEGS